MGPPRTRVRDGLLVTNLEMSIVQAWPLLAGDARRVPILLAIGDRMTPSARVRAALRCEPVLAGRAELVRLLDLLDAGCRSELELWGYQHVFSGPQFDRLRWQVPVRVDDRTYWLDAYDEASATDFELDGAKYHDGRTARERDIRRDAALARIGVQAVRFSHDRLTRDVQGVRTEAIGIMAIREHQLRGTAA